MNAILKNLKTLPGALLSLCVLLIILFWVLNFISKRAPAPLAGVAQKIDDLASGDAY